MNKLDLQYLKNTLESYGSHLEEIKTDTYKDIKINKEGTSLVDENGNNIGTKGDMYHKLILDEILQKGCLDKDPRPHYEDGQKAHTLSINHKLLTYDLSKGESPLTTLRPIATKSSIGEILWIYQDASNDLDVLKDKYNITWWDEWEVDNTRKIGSVYGYEVDKYDLTRSTLESIKSNLDGRRHIMDFWQYSDFKLPHGLKPCAFLTIWNVRRGRDNELYLDMELVQRSSDFCTAGAINQFQYIVLQHLFARHLGLKVGKFSWNVANIQIYDRHINQAIEMLNRDPINLKPEIVLNEEKTDFYDFTLDDIKLNGYDRKLILEKNPQLKFPIGI